MFSLGGSEILVLAFIALILFGNKNLPQTMKKMVKGLNEVKKVANEAQRSWIEVRDDLTRQVMLEEAEEEARKELSEIKKALAEKGHNESRDPASREEPLPEGPANSSAESLPTRDAEAESLPAIRPPTEGPTEVRSTNVPEYAQDDGTPHYENPDDAPQVVRKSVSPDQTSTGASSDPGPDLSPNPQGQKHTDT